MRDNFSEKVKKDLAGRAGYKCSNPDCRISTIEAKYVNEGTINIGEAAHIEVKAKWDDNYPNDMKINILKIDILSKDDIEMLKNI